MYDLDSLHAPPSLCPLPRSTVVAICECYLLVVYGCAPNYQLGLINPSMHTYRQLPNLSFPDSQDNMCAVLGLCHFSDELGDDLKVVSVVDFLDNSFERQVMVYSLRTGLWKQIECTTHDDHVSKFRFPGVTLQKYLFHLICTETVDCKYYRFKKIECFDIKAERWGPDVPLPNIHTDGVDFELDEPLHLGVLDEQLCFVVQNMNESTFDLWVMREYGIKESWVKLMCLCISYNPLTFRKGSPHELLCKRDYSSKLFWYNLEDEDEESIEIEFPGLRTTWGHSSTAYVCKGSLLNIPGSQLIREWCLEEERKLRS
ncbi:hypothetical protein RND81_10G245700 [Saponaria officinalis]|uniref:F-box associated beta-propeller type 1 domain-containing protein n=1 Tax=Saponaria officinalis TaxID=3572 RepID=A0AAW1I7H7_SAPOF